MTEFKKPTILKESDKIVTENGKFVIKVSILEYQVDDKKYPKLNISVYPQDSEGFPTSRPKSVNLPVSASELLIKALTKLK